jgi:hypothetical protein
LTSAALPVLPATGQQLRYRADHPAPPSSLATHMETGPALLAGTHTAVHARPLWSVVTVALDGDRCRPRRQHKVTALGATARLHAVELPALGVHTAIPEQLQAHAERLVYQLADASVAAAAAAPPADTGQQVEFAGC